MNKEYGATSVPGEAASRTKVSKIGISINEDGTTTFFAELEKASQQQMEQIYDIYKISVHDASCVRRPPLWI